MHEGSVAGRTPLALAVLHGHVEAALLLLQWSADCQAADYLGIRIMHYAVMHACTARSTVLVEALIEHTSGEVVTTAVDHTNWTVLHAACLPSASPRTGVLAEIQIQTTRLLLESNAQVNSRTIDLVTPLMVSVYHDTEWDQLLVAAADHALTNAYHETALDIACKGLEAETTDSSAVILSSAVSDLMNTALSKADQ